MKYCEACGKVNGEDERWCVACGRSLRDAVLLRGVTEHANQGGRIAERAHARSLRFSILVSAISAVIAQVAIMWLFGRVLGWWLCAHAALAVALVLLLFYFRLGSLSCIVVATASNFLLGYVSGSLTLTNFLSYQFGLWLLAFWYAFLGAHIAHSGDVDR